jgi:hypothetical protein
MAQTYRILSQSSWVLGLLGILAAAVVRLFQLTEKVHIESRSFLILAGTFFLCALATRAVERNAS